MTQRLGRVGPHLGIAVAQRDDEDGDGRRAQAVHRRGERVALQCLPVAEPGRQRVGRLGPARVGHGTVGLDGHVRVLVGDERPQVLEVRRVADLAEDVGGRAAIGRIAAGEHGQQVVGRLVGVLHQRPGEVLADAGVALHAQALDQRGADRGIRGGSERERRLPPGAAVVVGQGLDEGRDIGHVDDAKP